MRDILTIAKAAADDSRLKILGLLLRGELCVCHITEGLKLAPSTVSKHLSILEAAGLIETRKLGRWVHCRLPSSPKGERRAALRWLLPALKRAE
ncbi:MAG: metalloregulator ArsR/SmtB family transcription factor [Elusimicrobia bacterium]|nr:metalloregulator ArsR/SmtB family transcription factor [Elusimicrobiota bacterium]MDA8242806.1 metalloregulator ArsR/SmtB family transcription factor [Elusimicrobiota bacterium]